MIRLKRYMRNTFLLLTAIMGVVAFFSFLNDKDIDPMDNPIIMQLEVPETIIKYSQDFINDGYNAGLSSKMLDFQNYRIVLHRENLMGTEQWGLCDDKNKIIYYDEKLLNAHQALIRSVVYHEMAHCLLHRPHMFIYDLQKDIPTSIMYPYTNNLPPEVLVKYWDSFRKELFTNVEDIPVSHKTALKQNFKMFGSYLFKIETKTQWEIYKKELINFVGTLPLFRWAWTVYVLYALAFAISHSLIEIKEVRPSNK